MIDCECIAAACADSEWLPSLKMLAVYLRQQKSSGEKSSRSRIISRGVDTE